MLAILFLLGRVMGLHAHGHTQINIDHHENIGISQHHDHSDEKTHVANHFDGTHDFMNNHDEHGSKMFDIENSALVKKQSQFIDTNVLFLVVAILLFGIYSHLIQGVKLSRQFIPPSDNKLYLKNRPLRAPPHFA